MSPKPFSYNQYLALMADSSGMKMQEESKHLIERFNCTQPKTSQFAPVTFLIDYATRKYIYMDEGCFNLMGFSSSYYYESGLENYLKSWHPADFRIINEMVFPDNLKFLKTIPRDKYTDIIFTYNYRALNSKNDYVTIMQRCSYIPGNKAGRPCGLIGVAINITHFKNDMSIIHTIEEAISCNDGIVHALLFKKIHPVYDAKSIQLLSKKEIEILVYLAEGLSSKQIAFKTNLSINTINNHRKNMLAKLQCKSSSELVNYAVRHGLL